MGNCLFDALNAFLRVGSSHTLRTALCDYIAEHRATFEQAILALRYDSVEKYLERMRRDGVNGNHVMVCAAALKYRARVQIRMPNGRVFVEEPLDGAVQRRVFLKWVPGHYSVANQHSAQHKRHDSF